MKPTNPRGLIFTGELVPGVMSGAITVTTRIMKPQPPEFGDNGGRLLQIVPSRLSGPDLWDLQYHLDNPHAIKCPLRVGERRYVKEAWAPYREGVTYRAEDSDSLAPWHPSNEFRKWRSPMMMPRRFARTWVEILSVRPARCQEITREEILASGIVMQHSGAWSCGIRLECYDTSRDAYAALWDRLNADRGFPFSSNPWCWRVSFKRVDQ